MSWYSSEYEDVVVIMTYGPRGAAFEPFDVALTRAPTRPIGEARQRQLQQELQIAAAGDRRPRDPR